MKSTKSNRFTSQAVKRAREKAGLSQAGLAKLLKLSTPQSVSNIERGVSPLPWKMIRPLATAVNLNPVYFADCISRDLRVEIKRAAGI